MYFLFLIALIILIYFYRKLSARVEKCEQMLNQLKTASLCEPSGQLNTQPPSPPPCQVLASIATHTPAISTPIPAKEAFSNSSADVAKVQGNSVQTAASSTSSFKIPSLMKENWIGVFGSIAIVIGAVFFGLTSQIMQYPQARVAVMILASLLLFGIGRKLKNKKQWHLLCGWLTSIAGTMILFAAIGAGSIDGLQFIHTPLYALGFLCLAIAANVLLACTSPSQTVSSLHVILCILAFCLAPQSLILLPIGALVAVIGLINAYRAKWDLHLLLIVTAFSFQNFFWSTKLDSHFFPWMHGLSIACSLIVGLIAALIHYSKKYKSTEFEALALAAHIANWGFLALNLWLHSNILQWPAILLGSIAIAGFILARTARRKGILWLYHTDTLLSQLTAISALVCLGTYSVSYLDISLLILIETLAFSLIFQLQKENFLAKAGVFSYSIAAVLTLFLALIAVLKTLPVDHYPIYLRMGSAAAVCWSYYLFSSWKKLPIDDYRAVYFDESELNLFREKHLKNPVSCASILGSVFFLAVYILGFNSWIIQCCAFFLIAVIGAWRKFKNDGSSNLAMSMALIVVHAMNWGELLDLCLLKDGIPSLLSNVNFLGLACLDLLLIASNLAGFKIRKKDATPLLIYALGVQGALLAYVFTKGISLFIPAMAFMGSSIIALEAGRRLPKYLRCEPRIQFKVQESLIQVGLLFLYAFVGRFIAVHLQGDSSWHGISLRLTTEALGLCTLSYWLIFGRIDLFKSPSASMSALPSYSQLTQFLVRWLLEILLGFISLCVFVEVPAVWSPFVWIFIALVLCKVSFYCLGCVKAPGLDDRKSVNIDLILTDLRSFNRGSFHASRNSKNLFYRVLGLFQGSRWFSWPERLYGYSWIYFIASITHMAFAASSSTMPSLNVIGKYHLPALSAIALQFSYACIFHRSKPAAAFRVISILNRYSSLAVLLPAFLSAALFFALNFEKALLTILWVGLICVYLCAGLLIKSKRSIQIGMAALMLCSVRLILFDLVQSDLSVRALVFIGVGGLMLGMSALYKKYKYRIMSQDIQ